MCVIVARCFWIIQSFMCSLRWALSQQEGSAQLRSLCFGSLWSEKSWATTGSALTCSVWEPAACWLTSRDRWGLNINHFITNLLFCLFFFLISSCFSRSTITLLDSMLPITSCLWPEAADIWPYGPISASQTHTGSNLSHYSIKLS